LGKIFAKRPQSTRCGDGSAVGRADYFLGGGEAVAGVPEQRVGVAIGFKTPSLPAIAGESVRNDLQMSDGVCKKMGAAIQVPADIAASADARAERDANEIPKLPSGAEMFLGYSQSVCVVFDGDGNPDILSQDVGNGCSGPAGKILSGVSHLACIGVHPARRRDAQSRDGVSHFIGALQRRLGNSLQMI